MPEHTIPESLIENIRSGRAVLVVGVGIGIPSWKQILERMNQSLRQRGGAGDDAASKDVEKLLHKGSLLRAAGFLGRALGGEACDRVVVQAWSQQTELTPVARALAKLPFRQVWTTFPGDLLERAMEEDLPEGWSPPRVLTWERAKDMDRRRRTLLKVLGDFGSFVITPRSTRVMLGKAQALSTHVRQFYAEGTLIFVGFRYGDPDLAALLDRVFGQFEPPKGEHYLVGSGLGPVTVDELRADHRVEVVNLAGRGSDDRAIEALLEYLGELRAACDAAGIDLTQGRPDADDLEGWLQVLQEDPFDDEAAERLAAIEAKATAAEDWERVVEVLMARIETEGSAPGRAALLRQVAEVFEGRIGDLPRAFTALTAALREDPADTGALDRAEKLAEDTGAWAELVGDMAQVAGEIEDKEIASGYWTRLGRWYHRHLDHLDYAVASYREALKLDPTRTEAHRGLSEVFRVQQRWAELADSLAALAEAEKDRAPLLDLLLALGDLNETQLASTAKAIDAYQRAFDLDPDCDDALAALERLYRRDERWGKLARVLERRAEIDEAQGDAQQAAATRRELADMRADKLGDMEGAIARYESALKIDPRDAAALHALEELYDKVGRTPEYLRTLERLCDIAAPGEKAKLLRRIAVESEEREGGVERAIRSYEQVSQIEPQADDALRALERLYRGEQRWDDLLAVLARHAEATRAPATRADLWETAADVYEKELHDPHRAVEAHQNALAAQAERRSSLSALARLYRRIDANSRALEVLVQHARLEGDRGADLWVEAGEVAAELGDADVAQRHLERALSLDLRHQQALLALARLHQEGGQWANAASRLVEAAECTANRREKIDLLLEAAGVYDERLDQGERALGVWLKVLELDPEHEVAGRSAAERLCAAARWQEALPICEMLVRTAPPGSGADRLDRARREVELARVCAAIGMLQKAVKHYRAAQAADPGQVEAALGLSSALHESAQAEPSPERWREAQQSNRELLGRHQAALADGQMVSLWYRIGAASRELGENPKAEDAYKRALERDPLHVPSLEGLVALASARGDWKTVVAAKRDLMEAAEGDARIALLDEVGDLCRERMKDPVAALGAYLEAIKLSPGSHVLLHKALELYTETKQWRRAIDMLAALAATETEASRRRSKYHYAAAVIARDELDDVDLAIEHFQLALEDDPGNTRAFDAIDQALRGRGDYKNLARAYRKMLKRLGEEAPVDILLPLWTKLGEICLEQLEDTESAIAAFEVASSLDPDGRERHEQLAELYLEVGESRRQDAIEELQYLVQSDPDRVELYRALSNLYREEGELDKAFCLAQALVFLKAASPGEVDLYQKVRPPQLVLSKRRLTEELWQKAILHGREDRHVNAIFASLIGEIASSAAQPPSAYHLASKDRIDVAHEPRPVARMVKYAANVLGVELDPQLYVLPDGAEAGIRVANTIDRGKLAPALLVGEAQVERMDERELAFDLGKRMAYLRPDRYVSYAMTTLPTLESAFSAALTAAGLRSAGDVAPEAARLADRLAKAVPAQVLVQVAAIARKMNSDFKNGAIASWRTATDLTANRVGLILCNDLETAARRVAVETGGVSTLSAKDRLRDLLSYSVSEGYFAVRRHLGLAQEGRRSLS
ncbi:MAG TPA: SIR2 family protein [Kofleriaceae bacterium]